MVELSGAFSVPELKAIATSTRAGGTLATAVGSTLYEYDPEPADTSGTVEITVNLEGVINKSILSNLTGLAVAAGLFVDEGFSLPEASYFGALLAFAAVQSLPADQKIEINEQSVTANIDDMATMMLTDLVAGDRFFLFAIAIAQGVGALTAIPLPTPIALLSSALGLLLLRRRP